MICRGHMQSFNLLALKLWPCIEHKQMYRQLLWFAAYCIRYFTKIKFVTFILFRRPASADFCFDLKPRYTNGDFPKIRSNFHKGHTTNLVKSIQNHLTTSIPYCSIYIHRNHGTCMSGLSHPSGQSLNGKIRLLSIPQ